MCWKHLWKAADRKYTFISLISLCCPTKAIHCKSANNETENNGFQVFWLSSQICCRCKSDNVLKYVFLFSWLRPMTSYLTYDPNNANTAHCLCITLNKYVNGEKAKCCNCNLSVFFLRYVFNSFTVYFKSWSRWIIKEKSHKLKVFCEVKPILIVKYMYRKT